MGFGAYDELIEEEFALELDEEEDVEEEEEDDVESNSAWSFFASSRSASYCEGPPRVAIEGL